MEGTGQTVAPNAAPGTPATTAAEPKKPKTASEIIAAHRRMPYAWLLISLSALMSVCSMRFAWWCTMETIGGWELHRSLFRHHNVVALIFDIVAWAILVPATTLFIPIVSDQMLSRAWWREYWKRNVRGYDVWFFKWFENESRDGAISEIHHQVTGRGARATHHLLESTGDVSVVVIPLGGWFRRKRGKLLRTNVLGGGLQPLLAWDVIVRKPALDPFIHLVDIVDTHGVSISLTISEALRFVHLLAHTASVTSDWSHKLSAFMDAIREARRERDEAERNAAEEHARHNEAMRRGDGLRASLGRATATIGEAIAQVRSTSRFGHSVEALRLRVWLLEQLLAILPADDVGREAHTRELARAQVQLDRHTKKRGRGGAAARV